MNRFLLKISQVLVYLILRALNATYRYRIFFIENLHASENLTVSRSQLLCVWHEHLLPTSLAKIGYRVAPLISPSDDGSVIEYSYSKFGFYSTRGSSSRGGQKARSVLLDRLQEGWSPALAVDGPTGPRRQVKPGAIDLARKSGHPILPLMAIAKNPWILRTWDAMKIPAPFSKIHFGYGKPICVQPEVDGEEFIKIQQELAHALNDLEAQLFAMAGLNEIEIAAQTAPSKKKPRSERSHSNTQIS